METNTIGKNAYLFIIPLVFSLTIAALFYPGFMSYDTLHALRGARNGVTDSMWPPMVSYVWRTIDLVSYNPSAMHFSQIFLLLLSISYIIFLFTGTIGYTTLFLILYLSVPVIIGTIAVIWKDVLMAAFFLSSFSLIISIKITRYKKLLIPLSSLSLFLIFLGVCTRHNAIIGAIPLIFYLALIVSMHVLKTPLKLYMATVLLGTMFTGMLYFTKTQLDRYSLPDFIKMESSTKSFLESVRVLDVAGASVCIKKNLFKNIEPNLTISEIEHLYDPKHINLSSGLFSRIEYSKKINKIWRNIAIQHPICFFYNKFQLTKYLIGANKGEQFLITAPSIDANEYGYKLNPSKLRSSVVNYMLSASKEFFVRPWFLYLISIFAFFYLVLVKSLKINYLILLLSGYFYFISLVMFGNAADARLPFYSTTIVLLFIFLSAYEFYSRAKSIRKKTEVVKQIRT